MPGVPRGVGSAINLAVFRVVLFGYLAVFAATAYDFAWFAGLPDALRTPPLFTEWYTALPLTPRVIGAGQWALIATSVLAAIGWQTRATTIVATALAVLVLGMPNFYGWKVDHYHHLVWFAAILAASPCGDTLSIDAWRRGRPTPAPSRRYGVPLRFVWVLIGLIYFFPGVAKAQALPGWVAPENLRLHLYEKWAELDGFRPLLPVDQWPLGLSLAAAGTIAFELSFLPLILFRRTRPIAVAGGLIFHFMTAQMMAITFFVLQICYTAFIPWDRIAGWLRLTAGDAEPAAGPSTISTRIVGAAVVSLVLLAGVQPLDSWPFAAYPRFAYLATSTATRAELIPVDAGGEPMAVAPETWLRIKQRMKAARWERIQRRLGFMSPALREATASALFSILTQEDPSLRGAAHLDLYLTTRSVIPADRGAPPQKRVRVARIAVGPPQGAARSRPSSASSLLLPSASPAPRP